MPRVSTTMRNTICDGELRLPVAVAALALVLVSGACTTPSRHIAVTSGSDGHVVIYDDDFRVTDTVGLADAHTGRRVGAWLAYDGTTLFAAQSTATAGALVRARTADGTVLDRVDFYRGRPGFVYPLFDGQTVLALTIERAGIAARSTLHFLALDLSTGATPIPVCNTTALGLTTVRANDRVYVLCDRDLVVELDRELRTLIRSVQLPSTVGTASPPCGARDIGIASTGSIVFVLCAEAGTLLYLDRVTLEPLDSLQVGPGGSALARAPDGQHLVITRPTMREVVVADVRRRRFVGRIATEHAPLAVATGADSRVAFVTTGIPRVPGQLLKIDLETATVLAEATTVEMPITVSVWPGEESPVMRWED